METWMLLTIFLSQDLGCSPTNATQLTKLTIVIASVLLIFINWGCLPPMHRGDCRNSTRSDSLQWSTVVNMSKKNDPIYNIKLVKGIEKYPCLYNIKNLSSNSTHFRKTIYFWFMTNPSKLQSSEKLFLVIRQNDWKYTRRNNNSFVAMCKHWCYKLNAVEPNKYVSC